MLGVVALVGCVSATGAQDIAAGEAAFRKCQICHDVGQTAES
jgi:cytochrome c2